MYKFLIFIPQIIKVVNHNFRYNPVEILREIIKERLTLIPLFNSSIPRQIDKDWVEEKPNFWRNIAVEAKYKKTPRFYLEHQPLSQIYYIKETDTTISLVHLTEFITYTSRSFCKTDLIKRQQGNFYKGYKFSNCDTISISNKGVVKITNKFNGTKTLSFKSIRYFNGINSNTLIKLLCLRPGTEWLEKELTQSSIYTMNIPNTVIYSVKSREEFIDLLDVSKTNIPKEQFDGISLYTLTEYAQNLVFFTNPEAYLEIIKNKGYLDSFWIDIMKIAPYTQNVKFEYTTDEFKSQQILNDLLYLCAIKGVFKDSFTTFASRLGLNKFYNNPMSMSKIPF